MTSVLNVDTIADKAGTGPVGLTKQHAAKAWLHLDGSATFDASDTEIKDSFNVSTTVDVGTGNHSWSFVSAFSSADFSEALTSHRDQARLETGHRSASGSGIKTSNSSGTLTDSTHVQSVEHGDLA